MNRHVAGPPYNALDNGIQAKFARGLFHPGKQVERQSLIAICQAKGAITVDLVGGGRILGQ